jgi:muramoyltetrapeptide carboxypeptidase
MSSWTGFRRPPRLQPGMTIGVIAPSSAVRDPRLQAGLAAIRARGYQVVTGDMLYNRHGFLAGTDRGRAQEVTTMFGRKDIDAVFCARGGYGACRILEYVDWEIVRSNPKPFVGYSDITSLHLAIERFVGQITLHGPMVTTLGEDLSEEAKDCFWRMLERPEPPGTYSCQGSVMRTLVGGTAEGELAGGNLTLLCSAIGTPEMPDFRERIVLLEDIGEAAYRIDRMLVQLRRSGLLQQASGFVIGTATDWEKEEETTPVIRLEDIWRDHFEPIGKPTITGFPFGHVSSPLTIPLGCRAVLRADSCELTVLEPAVA